MIDTGDMIFISHNCSKTFSLKEMFHCYKHKLSKSCYELFRPSAQSWDSTALVVRDKFGPRVLSNIFSKVFDYEYNDFLMLPCIEDVAIRRLNADVVIENFDITEFKGLIHKNFGGKRRWLRKNQYSNGVEIVLNFWVKSGLIKKKIEECKARTVEDLQVKVPLDLEGSAKYSELIIVRTEFSKKEVKKY